VNVSTHCQRSACVLAHKFTIEPRRLPCSRLNRKLSKNVRQKNIAVAGNSLADSPTFPSIPEDSSVRNCGQEVRMQHGCMQRISRKRGPDVCSFAGPRLPTAAGVVIVRRSSVASSSTPTRMLPGVTGRIAPLVGKQPPPIRLWVAKSEAPTFLEFEGPLYEDGPIWRIGLAAPEPATSK
jgi:hypothetical protein